MLGRTSRRCSPVRLSAVPARNRCGPGPSAGSDPRLCDHWARDYDWRRCEDEIKGFGSYRTVLDGIDVHFLYARPSPRSFPCGCATAGLHPSWSSVTWSVR
ncbi:epoxide hydrolase N-terminal domain-containing protein [Streptomyces sp. NPDC005899]|uniref:epoxide hydrolase N-terminal domain-containing protein n=1 Tax=Streptomyces sp. NPDC005899 TaxID=3155716 RepID=UPI0033ECB708